MARLLDLAFAGDFDEARALDQTLARLHRALFLDASPSPAKRALALLGLCEDGVRLPLVALGTRLDEELKAAMAEAGVA
jgi:4-hydroxy-tetrahydrodipicolinate synthase